MNPVVFEAIMMVCFGIAWPFSIYKLLKTKEAKGKSILFVVIVFVGYLSGILYHWFGDMNAVIFLYILNALLVAFDLILTVRYGKNDDTTPSEAVVE